MKQNRETREIRETTLLELASMVLKQSIVENIIETDTIDIVEDLAKCRAFELVKSNKKIKYKPNIEAFTCEICCDRLYIIKHSSIDKALRYALSNIGEISIIYNNDIVVIGGYQNNEVYWGLNQDGKMYKIGIGECAHEEKNYNGIIYSTVDY